MSTTCITPDATFRIALTRKQAFAWIVGLRGEAFEQACARLHAQLVLGIAECDEIEVDVQVPEAEIRSWTTEAEDAWPELASLPEGAQLEHIELLRAQLCGRIGGALASAMRRA